MKSHVSATKKSRTVDVAAASKLKMKDKYKKHSCEFKNEAKCEEELDEESKNIEEEEDKFFEDEIEEELDKNSE